VTDAPTGSAPEGPIPEGPAASGFAPEDPAPAGPTASGPAASGVEGEGGPGPPDGSRIDRHLAEVRAGLDRVGPADLAAEVAAGAVVVDLRPEADRADEGALPGAIAVERIHLEWRLDRTSGAALPGVDDDTRVILFCNDGYASSLAAADLRALGIGRATDLAGGYRAWRRLHPDAT
jgi:rhodanese-related sulfurtransferase